MAKHIEEFEALTPQELHMFDQLKGRSLDGTTPEEVLVMGELEVAMMDGFLGGRATELTEGLVEIHNSMSSLSGRLSLPIDFRRRRKEGVPDGDSN
jgi:hypothetical protein